mgnify:CR=1 FL=1
MNRLLSARIEAWVLLVVILVAALAVMAAIMASRYVEIGGQKLGPLTPVIREISRVPVTLKQMLASPTADLQAVEQRFEGQAGFAFADAPGSRPDLPYLMVTRYDGDLRRSVSELVDLNTHETVNRWVYDVDPIWATLPEEERTRWANLERDKHTARFRAAHTVLTEEGDVYIHGNLTPLMKFDLCGAPVWNTGRAIAHHAIETDHEGNVWTPSRFDPKSVNLGGADFLDDTLLKVSPNGEVLYEKSVAQIVIGDPRLRHLLQGNGYIDSDPLHLNDIEPVREGGTLWRQGDVLLSLRDRSLILLFRPETDEVVWYHAGRGAWLHQHDVDVIDATRIGVFDNNAALVGNRFVTDGVNRQIVMDVTDNSWESVHAESFEAHDVRTPKQGRSALRSDGSLFVEETQMGRLLYFDADGDLAISYVNRASDGTVYMLNWSGLVDRATGDAVAARLADGACPAGDAGE